MPATQISSVWRENRRVSSCRVQPRLLHSRNARNLTQPRREPRRAHLELRRPVRFSTSPARAGTTAPRPNRLLQASMAAISFPDFPRSSAPNSGRGAAFGGTRSFVTSPAFAVAPGRRALLLPGLRHTVERRLDQVAAVVCRLRQVHHRRDRAHRVAPVVLAGVGEDRDGRDREPVASQLLPEPRRVRGHCRLERRPLGDSAGEAAGDRAGFAPGRNDLERQAGRRGRAVRG